MNELKMTGKVLRVRIPNYLTKIKTSNSRKKKYWLLADIENVPAKFQFPNFQWKDGKLYDVINKEFVVRNSKMVDKPNFQMINGNEIMRMHDMIRVKIVDQLKDHFKEYIIKAGVSTFTNPVTIDMKFEGHFGTANQDVDNMWIYHKCFIDSLVDLKIIPNDNVLHVRQAGQTTFYPIPEYMLSQMEFKIQELDMSDEEVCKTPITLLESNTIKPGEIEHEDLLGSPRILLGVGKKRVIFGAAKKAIRKSMFHCLNNFKTPMIHKEMYEKYANFFECFEEHRIKIIKLP